MGELSTAVILFVIAISSVFYIAASSILCDKQFIVCENYFAYAVAVGVISLVVSGAMLILEMVMGKANESASTVVSLFLFAWWAAGTGIATFKSPFVSLQATPNGYFSSWFALLASAYYLMTCVAFVRNAATQSVSRISAVIGVYFVSSVFYLTAAGIACESGSCTSYEGYAVAVGAIGLVLAMVLAGLNVAMPDKVMEFGKFVAGFLVLWWAVGTGIATFKAPFTYLGNGYFSGWFALFSSAYLLGMLIPEVGEKMGVSGATNDNSAPEVDTQPEE